MAKKLSELFNQQPKNTTNSKTLSEFFSNATFNNTEDYTVLTSTKGGSQYDPGLVPGMNQDEYRANQQTILDKWGNALPKFLGTAATSFIEPFTNLTYGVGSAIVNGEFENIYDNEVSRTFDSLNKTLAEEFPHYYTEKEKQAEWWKSPMYANFWADKVGNGAGFMLGALASGYVTAGSNVFGNAASRGTKLFQSIGKTTQAGIPIAAEGGTVLSDISRLAKAAKIKTAANQIGASLVGAVGESGMEARSIKDETFNQLYEEKSKQLGRELNDQEVSQIEDIADAAGNTGFALNMAIVGSSNLFQFGSLFKGYNQERKVLNKIINEQGTYKTGGNVVATTGKALATPVEESIQESAQFATEKGVSDYYSRKYDKDGQTTVNDIIESTIHGLRKAYGTKEGLENALVGAILGGTGSVGAVADAIKASPDTQKAVAVLNQYKLSQSFKPLYEAAVKHVSYQKDKEKALERGDIFAYKNAEFDQFKSYVKSRIDTNQFDKLIDEIETVKGMSEEEFKSSFGFDQLPKDINEYVNSLTTKAKELYKIHSDIENAFGTLAPNVKERMFDKASTISNIDSREEAIGKELQSLTRGQVRDTSDIERAVVDNLIYSTEFLPDTAKQRVDEVKTEQTERFLKALNVIRELHLKQMNGPRKLDYSSFRLKDKLKELGVKDHEYRKAYNDAIDQYTKNNPLHKEKVRVLINDLNKLAEQREYFIESYNTLLDPEYQRKAITIDEKQEEKQLQQEEVKQEKSKDIPKITAAQFVEQNIGKFNTLKELATALNQTSFKDEILNKHRSIVDDALLKDPNIVAEEVSKEGTKVQAKPIPEKIRSLYGNHTHFDVNSSTAFTPDVEISTEKPVEQSTPVSETVPVNAIKVSKSEPREQPNTVTTRNSEFNYTKIKSGQDEYIVPKLDEAGIPELNQYDKELFRTDFNLVSNPNELRAGTKVTLEIIPTPDFTTKEGIVVKYNNTIVGKLALKNTEEVFKAIRSNGPIEVTLNGKWGSGAIRTNKTDTSLNDIKSLSSHHLPEGKIVIGTVKDDSIILPKEVSIDIKNNLNINNKVNGKNFAVLVTPEGSYFPEHLWNTPLSNIIIEGKKVSDILIESIDIFLRDINMPVEGKKISKEEALTKWNSFKKSNIIPIANYSIDKYDLGISVDRNSGEYVAVLNKGTKEAKKYVSGKDIVEDIEKRFFNVNSNLIEENKPFTFLNKKYESYTQFLVDNNILTTSLYAARPFSFTELDIDISGITEQKPKVEYNINTQKIEEISDITATEEGKKEEEDERKRKLKEKINKVKSGPSDMLTRSVSGYDGWTVWTREKELAWFSRNLPQIPVEVVNSTLAIRDKFGVEAHGVFSKGVVYLANNSEVGTSYHEAFHAVFGLYLSEEERNQILTETGKTEEQLAEDFRDYVLSEGEVSPKGRAAKFFKDILLWIKNLLGLRQINDLYYRINSGKFSKSPIKGETIGIKPRVVEGFNAVEQKRRIDASVAMLFNELKEMTAKASVLDIETLTVGQLEEAFDTVKAMWEITAEEQPAAAKVFNNFDKLKPLIMKELERFGFAVKPEYLEFIEEDEQEAQSNNTKE
jgi:hypothetical protein